MPLSQYMTVYPVESDQDHLLLFSTKRASKIILPKDHFISAREGRLDPDLTRQMEDLGFIVPDLKEEQARALNRFKNLNREDEGLTVIVVPNLDCNFKCVYCYEEGLRGRQYIDQKTVEGLLDFIRRTITNDKKTLTVVFHGGEPLLSHNTLKHIASSLKDHARRREVDFHFSLVTNGSLLTPRVVEELLPLGLTGVKVTIDGPAHTHNRLRPFKTGKASFSVIMKNILTASKFIQIGIGGNYDRQTYREYPSLLDDLQTQGMTPDKVAYVKFDPIIRTQAAENALNASGFEGCRNLGEPWQIEAEFFLREAVLQRGFRTPGIKAMFCTYWDASNYIVNYDGQRYKCPAFVGMPEFAIGDMGTAINADPRIATPPYIKNEECRICRYLPLCYGGCRYMVWLKDGDITGIYCMKDYLDKTLETLVKQEIKYGRRVDRENALEKERGMEEHFPFRMNNGR